MSLRHKLPIQNHVQIYHNDTSIQELNENQQYILRSIYYFLMLKPPNPNNRMSYINDLFSPILNMSRKISSEMKTEDEKRTFMMHFKNVSSYILNQNFNHFFSNFDLSKSEILHNLLSLWKNYNISKKCFEMIFYVFFIASQKKNKSSFSSMKMTDYDSEKKDLIKFCNLLWKNEMSLFSGSLFSILMSIVQDIRNDLFELKNTSNLEFDMNLQKLSQIINLTLSLDYDRSNHQNYLDDVNFDPNDSFYQTFWEENFMNQTMQFYAEISQRLIKEDVFSLIQKTSLILDFEEEALMKKVLHVNSRKEYISRIKTTIVASNISSLIDIHFFENMIQISDNNHYLTHYYNMMKRCQSIDMLIIVFNEYLNRDFNDLFNNLLSDFKSDDRKVKSLVYRDYCVRFIENYNRVKKIIINHFQSDQKIMNQLNDTTKRIFNENSINNEANGDNYAAMFIAKYANDFLTNTKILLNDATSNPIYIDGIILLLNMVYAKDIFSHYYQTMFMNRLLRYHSFNRDVEIELINRFSNSDLCEMQFTNNLSKMLDDIDISNRRYEHFGNRDCRSSSSSSKKHEMKPIIISQHAWPLGDFEYGNEMNMSPDIQNYLDEFNHLFKSANEGRYIYWLNEKSTVIVDFKPNKDSKTYKLTVNFYQYAVMKTILTSPKGYLTLSEINEILKMNPLWFERTIQSLKSTALLQENAKSKIWRINPNFSVSSVVLNAAIRFMRPSGKDTKGNDEEEDVCFEQQREINTQAAIIRIMKARRVMNHSDLCTETINQTSKYFPQTIGRIKRQIEKLIHGDGENRYLERIDNKTYKYVTDTNPTTLVDDD